MAIKIYGVISEFIRKNKGVGCYWWGCGTFG
jgi:hypothetical protein